MHFILIIILLTCNIKHLSNNAIVNIKTIAKGLNLYFIIIKNICIPILLTVLNSVFYKQFQLFAIKNAQSFDKANQSKTIEYMNFNFFCGKITH